MRNDKIHGWFEIGEICEALLGVDEFFISDVTDRNEHDRIFVMRQLLLWANTNAKEIVATKGIETAILVASSKDDIWVMLDILLSYLVVTENDTHFLPLDISKQVAVARKALIKNKEEISKNSSLKYFVSKMIERLPNLKYR